MATFIVGAVVGAVAMAAIIAVLYDVTFHADRDDDYRYRGPGRPPRD